MEELRASRRNLLRELARHFGVADHPTVRQDLMRLHAIGETMRFLGSVRGTARFASEDIEYRDVFFPKGSFIAPSLAQANRDASVFDEPTVFDITREPSNRPQLTFGSGIHYCLGAALARAEQQEALTILSQRLPDLELDGEIVWKPATVGIFGPEHLPVRFTPA